MDCPPVDLSFKDLSNVKDALEQEPRRGLRPLKTNSEKKYLSQALCLSNNKLDSIISLPLTLMHFLAEPTKLSWLNLSFNKLKYINDVLCELKELRILYLHGNSISELDEVDKLGQLSLLHTITLHGNDIEKRRGYRSHVILSLPHLKNLDFSVVTPKERLLANMWSKNVKKPKECNASLEN